MVVSVGVGDVLAMLRAKQTPADLRARKATAQNSDAAFLNLPAEIRNHVYAELIPPGERLLFVAKQPQLSNTPEIVPRTFAPIELGLSRVCHQLHKETAPLIFSTNLVCCESLPVFTQLLSLLTVTQLGYIRQLHIMATLDDTSQVNRFFDEISGNSTTFAQTFSNIEKVTVVPIYIAPLRHGRNPIHRFLENEYHKDHWKLIEAHMSMLDDWFREDQQQGVEIVWELDGLKRNNPCAKRALEEKS